MNKTATLLVFMLAATSALAQSETVAPITFSEDEQLVLEFFERENCNMSKESFDILVENRIAETFLDTAIEGGAAQVTSRGTVVVFPPYCGEEIGELPHELVTFIEVFKAHNCSLGEALYAEEALFALFSEVGFDKQAVQFHAGMAMDLGIAEENNDVQGLTILPPYCVESNMQ